MREIRVRTILIVIFFVWGFASAASGTGREDLARIVKGNQTSILRELTTALSIPDVAADRDNIRRKAEFLKSALATRGFSAELLETQGNPLVYGDLRVPGASRTILFYAHYDGQPVDFTRWKQKSPFIPILRNGKMEDGATEVEDFLSLKEFNPDWRIYARSSSDDTSPIIGLLAALDAVRSAGHAPSSNLRVILDGEEEASSPSLVPAIESYKDRLAADLMIILDGPIHPSNRPTVVFGARGIVTMRLTVYGPKFSLHSGHYGNWVPNPAFRLAQLLASMKDEEGRVLVKDFYQGIEIPDSDRQAMARVPDDEDDLKRVFGIASADAVGATLQEARNYPSLNIRGMRSAWTGEEARTIVPDSAVAEIDIRLVVETPGQRQAEKVVEHIRAQGYHVTPDEPSDEIRAGNSKIVRVEVSDATEAYRTPLNDPRALEVTRALENFWGREPVKIRTSGGTVPISPFIRALQFPAVSLPIVNYDNNQHSPNENLRLGHMWEGILSMAAVLTM